MQHEMLGWLLNDELQVMMKKVYRRQS